MTKLAAFTADCEVFEITLSRGYNENSFRDDLKILYNKLGIENKKVVFLFTDQHVAEECMLLIIAINRIFDKKHVVRVEFVLSTFKPCNGEHV